MNKLPALTASLGLILASPFAAAGTILYYDSDGANDLSRIASQTDASLVSSSDANTSLGSSTSFNSAQASQAQTVTLGSGTDLQYRFGTGVVNGTVADSLANGIWLGTSFVAAQDLSLDQLSFKLYNNSNNGTNYSARDVAAFVRIGTSGAFTQFGATHDTVSGNGNQGTITFTDTFAALLGETVQIRFAFTDRTRPNQDAQGSTRVGSIDISAVATSLHFFDINGTTAGFGEASGSYLSTDAYWSTSSAGTSTPGAWANARHLHFGHPGTTGIAGNSFTIDFTGTPGNSSFASLNINQPATVSLAGSTTKNVFPSGDQTWSIASGATLDLDVTWDSNGTIPGGLNHNSAAITLLGGGTINYNTAVLMNGNDGHLDQNDANLTVNLKANANWDATVLQGSYILNAGQLNFATAASADAFSKMDAGKSLTLNGGALDNTSGTPLTLDSGSGSFLVGGNFTFAGSNDLNLGHRTVSLNNATRTLTIAANTLGIGGVITDGGLIKEGPGTLLLSGNNTYAGPTTINNGTLQLGSSQLPTDLKVLSVGDSITFGFGGTADQSGYRRYLYDSLQPVMPDFQYIGVKDGRAGILPTSPLDQTQHLGLGSYALNDISNNLDGLDNSVFNIHGNADRDPEGGYWLDGGNGTGRDPLNPDIILMMLGTNDMNSFSGVQGRLNSFLTKVTTMRPNAHVIVANIVPRTNASLNANSIAYNTIVDHEIALFRENGHKVSGVDLHTNYPSGAFVDGTHPNNTGYQWMAEQWYAAVNAVATELPDNNLTPVSHSLATSSLVTIAAGGTLDLDGTQTTLQALTVAGTLLPAGGNLTIDNNLLLQSTATLSFGVGSTSDQITVNGNLTIDGTVNLSDAGGFTSGTYTLFTYTGTLTDNGLTISTQPDPDLLYNIDTSTPGLVQLIVQTQFEAWQDLHFGVDAGNPLIAGPLANPDLDQNNNLLEYFGGTIPTDPNSEFAFSSTELVGPSLVTHYPRALNRPDVSGSIEWSTNLNTWHDSGDSDGTRVIDVLESVISAPEADPETIEATLQTSSGPPPEALFIRLRVTGQGG